MRRHAPFLASCLLVGCASTAVPSQYHHALGALEAHPADARPSEAPAELDWRASTVFEPPAADSNAFATFERIALEPQQPPRGAPAPRPVGRVTLKGGYYGAHEDEIDDGWIAAVSWMQFMSPNFATEFEIGYLDVEGKDGGIRTDMWGLPIMLNGRFNLPVGRFEIFGGAGFGTIYFDGDANGAAIDVSADGWLAAGDVFAGAALNLRNGMTLGFEWKHYFTDSSSDLDTGLDADAVMLTLGLDR
jgi:opacity protein-like surface antigen